MLFLLMFRQSSDADVPEMLDLLRIVKMAQQADVEGTQYEWGLNRA